MTEQRMKELAAEAWERHKGDPAFADVVSDSTGQGKAKVATPAEAFWYWWCSWMNNKTSRHPGQSLAYKGKDDPTANTAIGLVMKEEKGGN